MRIVKTMVYRHFMMIVAKILKKRTIKGRKERSKLKQHFIEKIGESKMKYDDFTSGEYVKKEDVMTYLRVFNWDMPREELIEKFKGIPSITLNSQDIGKVKINKLLNGEWNND